MLIVRNVAQLQSEISKAKNQGQSIGFVPTMGALHAGHIALVERSVAENDFNVVSIFVNPTQFNNASDLEKYPRNLDADALLLEKAGCNLIFAPEIDAIYTENEKNTRFEFNFEGLDMVMEGKFRPGHFNGVVQIVSKLFTLVKPTKSYFGEKDFQQLSIIHLMTQTMGFDVEIVDCPIVREASGLAMSSRNERLTATQREIASGISKVLFESKTLTNKLLPAELTRWVENEIAQIESLKLEYFEIVDAKNLQTANNWNTQTVGCIAVFC
ncbi:MAG: pantoate--beta-alanine ligase, partial [Paludibacter sp.]